MPNMLLVRTKVVVLLTVYGVWLAQYSHADGFAVLAVPIATLPSML